VAKALGIPEGTAKSRLRLALARLRTMLDDEMRAAIR
jgi:DNA-directed RNA polymerase specialized sigma24 family protein